VEHDRRARCGQRRQLCRSVLGNPSPLTNEIWSFSQVHDFLISYNFEDAIIWRYNEFPAPAPGAPAGRHWTTTPTLSRSPPPMIGCTSSTAMLDLALHRPTCTATACPGWQKIDHNARTESIAAGGTLY
jgi:hypothetical protein